MTNTKSCVRIELFNSNHVCFDLGQKTKEVQSWSAEKQKELFQFLLDQRQKYAGHKVKSYEWLPSNYREIAEQEFQTIERDRFYRQANDPEYAARQDWFWK
jgi:two-component SAPR family response regulator